MEARGAHVARTVTRPVLVTAALAALAVATALCGAAAAAPAGPPRTAAGSAATARVQNGLITFNLDPGTGRTVIKTVRPDGTHLRTLVADPTASAESPAWSHDGRRLVYFRPTDTGCHIILARPDGTHRRDLTGSRGGCEATPTFTPSGRRILFVMQRCDSCRTWITSMDLHGRHLHRILRAAPNTGIEDVVLSPDGRRIAFESGIDPNLQPFHRAILVAHRDGTHLRTLVRYRFDAGVHFDWSSSGRWLVYTRWSENPPGHEANVVLVRPDGSREVHLTHVRRAGRAAGGATFSPDGRQIVYRFANLDAPHFWLATMHLDGSHKTRIRELAGPPQGTVWAPRVVSSSAPKTGVQR